MCPSPTLPMNLSINMSPAKMAASAILSVLPIRFFLLSLVRSLSLFSQGSSIKKPELSGGEKKGNELHKNNIRKRLRGFDSRNNRGSEEEDGIVLNCVLLKVEGRGENMRTWVNYRWRRGGGCRCSANQICCVNINDPGDIWYFYDTSDIMTWLNVNIYDIKEILPLWKWQRFCSLYQYHLLWLMWQHVSLNKVPVGRRSITASGRMGCF